MRAQFKDSNKPPQVIEKIVEGKLNSYYAQVVLLDQPSIRDPKTPIRELINAAIAKLGENITVARFVALQGGRLRLAARVIAPLHSTAHAVFRLDGAAPQTPGKR